MPKHKPNPKEEARKAQARAERIAQEEREARLSAAKAPRLRHVKGLVKDKAKTLAEIIRAAYPDGIINELSDDGNQVELSFDGDASSYELSYNPEKGEINLNSSNATPLEIYQVGIRLSLQAFGGRFEIIGPEDEQTFMLGAFREILSNGSPEEKSTLEKMIKQNKVKVNGKFVGYEKGELTFKDNPSRQIKPLPPTGDN